MRIRRTLPNRSVLLFASLAPAIGGSLFAAAPSALQGSVAPAPEPGASQPAKAFAGSADRELRENILPFWLKHAPDHTRGGFVGRIEQDMKVRADAPRGVLLTSRILWTFSAAFDREGRRRPENREMAERAYQELLAHGWDSEHGGVFWTTTADGRPADDRKHIYGQAFAIYALSEYARVFHQPEARDRAIALYRLVEKNARDHTHGGYFEGFSRDWKLDGGALRILGTSAPKSQNTHLHVMEAYSSLLRLWPDPELRARQRALVELMLTRVLDQSTYHLGLFFAADWSPLSGEISYGHDIEFSWLIVEAAEGLDDAALLKRAKTAAVAITDATLREGVDTDGGIFNEGTAKGVTNPTKDWWPQAEAVVGFLNAYQLTGERRFFDAAQRTWSFIETKFVDRAHGDWYESLARDGTPLARAKLSVWKCPYHTGRACLEISARLSALEGAH